VHKPEGEIYGCVKPRKIYGCINPGEKYGCVNPKEYMGGIKKPKGNKNI
jgi:hypothetical protein